MRDVDADAIPRYHRPPPCPTPPVARLMGHEAVRLRQAPACTVQQAAAYPNASMSAEVRARRDSSGRRSPRLVGSLLGEEVLRTSIRGRSAKAPVFTAGGTPTHTPRTPSRTRTADRANSMCSSRRSASGPQRTPSSLNGSVLGSAAGAGVGFVEFRGHRQAYTKAKRFRSRSSEVAQRRVAEEQRRCGYGGVAGVATPSERPLNVSGEAGGHTPRGVRRQSPVRRGAEKDVSVDLRLPSPAVSPTRSGRGAGSRDGTTLLPAGASLLSAGAPDDSEVDVDWVRALRRDPVHCRREFSEWLSRSGFPVPAAKSPSVVENPLLNGTLLLEVAVHAEALLMEADWSALLPQLVDAPPRSVADCRMLYTHVYTVIERHHKLTPATFARAVDDVLSGDIDTAWSLCWVVLKGYPPHIYSNIRQHVRAKSMFAAYDPEAMRKLEWCAVSFLFSVGLIRQVPKPSHKRLPTDTYPPSHYNMENFARAACPPETIADDAVLPYICNGTLLCELAGMLTRRPVVGVTPYPRVKKACIANIAAALAALRTVEGMSKVYVNGSVEEAVYAGGQEVILVLLEDVMRYLDKQPPRRHRVRPGDVPYLPEGLWTSRAGWNMSPPASYLQLAEWRPERSEKYPIAPSLASPRLVPTPSQLTPRSGRPETPRSQQLHTAARSASRGDPRSHSARGRPAPPAPAAAPRPQDTPPHPSQRTHTTHAQPRRGRSASPALAASPARPPQPVHVGSTSPQDSRPPPGSPQGSPGKQAAKATSDVGVLEAWVKALLGRRVALGGEVLPAFHDGTLLSDIFHKVERQYTQLAGIVMQPKRDAQKRFNIKKIVSLFNSRRSVIDLMREPEDEVAAGVFDGDGTMIRKLLWHVRKHYNHTKIAAGGARNINQSKMEVLMRAAEDMVPERAARRAPLAQAGGAAARHR